MRYALLLAAGATLTGCANHDPRPETDAPYTVEWIGKRPLVGHSHITLTLDDQGRAYGNAGCNHWFASYRLDGEQLSFAEPGSTRRACAPAVMEQEQRFLAALASVQRWEITEQGQLRLFSANERVLRLKPED
ncbi:MAG: hypothetical protein GAK43_02076 [Stenotrophomonas maltophilia]|nr:MAG: hypothetical protein GAK43_02076 [Stenotrophomonas maltophilia]